MIERFLIIVSRYVLGLEMLWRVFLLHRLDFPVQKHSSLKNAASWLSESVTYKVDKNCLLAQHESKTHFLSSDKPGDLVSRLFWSSVRLIWYASLDLAGPEFYLFPDFIWMHWHPKLASTFQYVWSNSLDTDGISELYLNFFPGWNSL